YLTFDTVVRLLRDAGAEVRYIQNVTDVDDPLLERAAALGVDWRRLAADQIELFRTDQELLRIVPPTEYVGVVESVHRIANAVVRLYFGGFVYAVPGDGFTDDLYFDLDKAAATEGVSALGSLSHYDGQLMLRLSAERGGDP